MYAEINAAVQATKVLFEFVKANKGLVEYNELVVAVSDVNMKLTSAINVAIASQEKQLELTKRISELEELVMERNSWKHESDRYELDEICRGVVVYTLKTGKENGEPDHYLCAACFNKRQKGYLHRTKFNVQGTHYKCDGCGFEILDHSKKPDPEPDIYVDVSPFF